MKSKKLGLVAGAMALAAVAGSATSAKAECVVGVASWDVLWIRTGPSTRYSKVGAIPYDACGVRVFWGACRGSWCRVSYRGVHGWSSVRYLGN